MATKWDVNIAHVECDLDFAKDLKANLQKEGLKVQLSDEHEQAGINSGQTVVNCKVFILVLSAEGMQEETPRMLKDRLALAYISNKYIIPVARQPYDNVEKHLDGGLKLMLAKINWTLFINEEEKVQNLVDLVGVIKKEIADTDKAAAEESPAEEKDTDCENAYNTLYNHTPGVQLTSEAVNTSVADIKYDFWNCHFKNEEKVAWTEFKRQFLAVYEDKLTKEFDAKTVKWFVNLLYKDVLNLNKIITKQMYHKFCGNNVNANADHFYERLKDYGIGSFAMREVFDMESTVRLAAIQNLSSYDTAGVIAILYDFVNDADDPNIRAVACLALAKTGNVATEVADKLMGMLEDEDRVVRESACLSLAHMKCMRAVPNIIDLWRNDAIKHVREAAEIALARIGGEQAERAIKITQVLSGEMNNLRDGVVA